MGTRRVLPDRVAAGGKRGNYARFARGHGSAAASPGRPGEFGPGYHRAGGRVVRARAARGARNGAGRYPRIGASVVTPGRLIVLVSGTVPAQFPGPIVP